MVSIFPRNCFKKWLALLYARIVGKPEIVAPSIVATGERVRRLSLIAYFSTIITLSRIRRIKLSTKATTRVAHGIAAQSRMKIVVT